MPRPDTNDPFSNPILRALEPMNLEQAIGLGLQHDDQKPLLRIAAKKSRVPDEEKVQKLIGALQACFDRYGLKLESFPVDESGKAYLSYPEQPQYVILNFRAPVDVLEYTIPKHYKIRGGKTYFVLKQDDSQEIINLRILEDALNTASKPQKGRSIR